MFNLTNDRKVVVELGLGCGVTGSYSVLDVETASQLFPGISCEVFQFDCMKYNNQFFSSKEYCKNLKFNNSYIFNKEIDRCFQIEKFFFYSIEGINSYCVLGNLLMTEKSSSNMYKISLLNSGEKVEDLSGWELAFRLGFDFVSIPPNRSEKY